MSNNKMDATFHGGDDDAGRIMATADSEQEARDHMYDDDDLGTVRWFGESWQAPINDPRTRIETPTGYHCIECGKWIESDDRGLRIPAPEGYVVYHHLCFFDAIGVPHER